MSRVTATRFASLTIGLVLVAGVSVAGAGTRLNFVSCPIVRDTATVPCWLTEYEGELYYMGIQTDVSAEFHPPYLGHRVLVEAVVADDRPRICGGVVLDPIRISVMPELDRSCNTMLPAEDRFVIDFNPRPPGPSGGRLAFDPPPGAAAPEPVPDGPGTFRIYYDVDRTIGFGDPAELIAVRDYAERIGARRIRIRASRGAMLLTNGDRVVEAAGIAGRRAAQVAHLLTGLGVRADISTQFTEVPAPADGIDDWKSRVVEISVLP